jgi:hypothetical protein
LFRRLRIRDPQCRDLQSRELEIRGLQSPEISVPGILRPGGSRTASSFSASEAAGGVLADFHFFVKKLDALLAELLAVAMLELGELAIECGEWRFIFHGDEPPRAA